LNKSKTKVSIIEESEKSERRSSVQTVAVSNRSGRRKSKISTGIIIDKTPKRIILHKHTIKVLRPSISQPGLKNMDAISSL
jgi:hypothetical protein